MTAQNYTIPATGVPVDIRRDGYNHDTLVYNTGTVTVYVDNATTASVSSAFPLPPGATKVWSAGDPLYAVVATGGSAGIINVSDNAGDLFNPKAIADQIVTSGLTANAIATAITGGTTLSPSAIATSITGGNILSPSAIAAQINVVGVPAIDVAASVYSNSFSIGNGVTPSIVIGPLDVSRYQSLRIRITESPSAGGTLAFVAPRVYWFDWDAGGTATWRDVVRVPSAQGSASIQVPTRSPRLTITPMTAVGIATTVNVDVIGSYRPQQGLSVNFVQNLNGTSGLTASGFNDGSAGVFTLSGSFPVGTTIDYPNHVNSQATLFGNVLSSTGVTILSLMDTFNQRIIAELLFNAVAARNAGQLSVTLPASPVQIRVIVAGSAINANFGLSYGSG